MSLLFVALLGMQLPDPRSAGSATLPQLLEAQRTYFMAERYKMDWYGCIAVAANALVESTEEPTILAERVLRQCVSTEVNLDAAFLDVAEYQRVDSDVAERQVTTVMDNLREGARFQLVLRFMDGQHGKMPTAGPPRSPH